MRSSLTNPAAAAAAAAAVAAAAAATAVANAPAAAALFHVNLLEASYGSAGPGPVLGRLPKSFGFGCRLPGARVATPAAGELHGQTWPPGEGWDAGMDG